MFDSVINGSLTWNSASICTIVSVVLGLFIALCYTYKKEHNKNFVITLVILPAVIQMVIMMVNGNIGAGIAVAGAFSLVRFRSVPGGSKEISSIFLTMAVGLATGMGYVWFACIFTVFICLVMILLTYLNFGSTENKLDKNLKIVVSEDFDYTKEFDEVFKQYLDEHELKKVKTTNLGSLFELTYKVTFKKDLDQKKFIDDLRFRNGNLPIICSEYKVIESEL